MDTIKVTIKELGNIRDSVVELAPVMIFSGESGLGKSYLAMLCHYFFDMLLDETRINRFFKEKGWVYSEMRTDFHGIGTAVIIDRTILEDWMAKDAIQYLSYMLNNDKFGGNISIKLPSNIEDKITIQFEEEMIGLENNEDVYVKLSGLNLIYRAKDETIESESPFAILLRYGLIRALFGDFRALKDTYVFPPSRGPVMTERVMPRTGLYEKFQNSLERINRIQPHPEETDKRLIKLLNKVLEGSVKRISDDYQYTFKGEEISISAAAASIREIAPIAMLVEKTDIKNIVMMIEEPETHLHPIKQRMMADVMSIMCSGGAYMQITTHSDYFLRRLNELISLKRIHEKCEDEEVFDTICEDVNTDKRLEFDYSRLAAYLLVRREDGSSFVEKQSIDDGIPFASFSKAIDESLQSRYKLNNYAEKYGCD